MRFDNVVLEKVTGQLLPVEKCYDILREAWIALGLDPDTFDFKTHGNLGLDAFCRANLGMAKTGHGGDAPVWWQQAFSGC